MITIILNGEKKSVMPHTSIASLVLSLELDIKKIAVEKDLEIILPEKFSEIFLDEGARIEIVHFIGGG